MPTFLDKGRSPPLDKRIDFGAARLIPGNTPRSWVNLGPVQPDWELLSSPAIQASVIRDWLIQFGIANGYQDIEQEVARWADQPHGMTGQVPEGEDIDSS